MHISERTSEIRHKGKYSISILSNFMDKLIQPIHPI